MKSDTTLKGPRCTNSTRSTSDRCAGHRAGSTGCALGVVILASLAEEMLLDGPGDMLGAAAFVPVDMVLDGPGDVLGIGSVSPLVANCSIDHVMTKKPSYKQIIKICFGLNGKLHNEMNLNT